MSLVHRHLSLLGLRVKDRVTGFEGIGSSVCFDLYGCIQCAVNPGLDKDGKAKDSMWFDVSRLVVVNGTPCMDRPDFCTGPVAEGRQGCAERPAGMKP